MSFGHRNIYCGHNDSSCHPANSPATVCCVYPNSHPKLSSSPLAFATFCRASSSARTFASSNKPARFGVQRLLRESVARDLRIVACAAPMEPMR